jgi:LCP family protein required for cell wall assembly
MSGPPPHSRRRTLVRFLIAAVVVVFFSGSATATAILLEVADVAHSLDEGAPSIKVSKDVLAEVATGKPQTILVIGSDRRWKDRKDKKNARSDTIILVRLNPKASASTVMSIPRDLKVTLRPGAAPDKINAAFSIGGPAKTAKVVKKLLSRPGQPFNINHIINVNFSGFTAVVNRLGCVLTDVDRNYFNDNNPPVGGGGDYATIDIKPGYQRLCGGDALDFVRFRHLDTDIVRAARQQDFLKAMKQQYTASQLFGDRRKLVKIVGKYTQTDNQLHHSSGLLKVLNLVLFSGRRPVHEVHFPAQLGDATDPFVTVNPLKLNRAVDLFLRPTNKTAPRPQSRKKKGRKKKPAGPVPGLVNGSMAGEQQGTLLGAGVGLPVYYPKLITAEGHYMGPLSAGKVYPRRYSIKANGHRYASYRLTLDAGSVGEFYGIQGTRWKDPPILQSPSEFRRVNGKRLALFFDGDRLRLVAWRTPQATYWISNTLLESIPTRQMLAMAGSLTRIGSSR